ncbi:MAG: hypothetical protein KDA94_00820 [Acidimicrobiales bacterium]|nr:hypothetical protein [Acidimicrobiales bacterium]
MGLDVHQLIGRRPEEVAWVDLVGLPLPPPSEIDEIRTYHAFPGLGFELISEPPDVGAARVVVSIMLYSGRDRTDGFERFEGELPWGLSFGWSRHDCRRHLGEPDRSKDAREVAGVGRQPPYDRWNPSSELGLWCHYSFDESLTDRVDVAASWFL